MISQTTFNLTAKRRGCHLVTREILEHLPQPLPQTGLLNDMPAHAKYSLFGVSLTIPITVGRLNLGTWQGIYLCEFRNYGGLHRIVATIYE